MQSGIEMRSIKYNFLLNNIRLGMNFIIPVIVFPYVSRVLGPDSLGKVEFANSLVSYFVLFTAIGIPTYGVREIARVRDNVTNRSKTVFELSVILVVTVFCGYIVYFLCIILFPTLYREIGLFLIIAPTIFLSDFSYEWFYIGIENQQYITIRYIFVKIVQVILIFVFIRNSDQYIIYAAITISMNGLSTVFNIYNLRKYIRGISLKTLDVFRHIKPILIIFSSLIATNVYMHIDVTMIGTMVSNEAVGIYVVPNRVIRIVIHLVTSLGTVIIPRLENYLSNGDVKKYYSLLNKSLSFTLLFSVPCFFGIILVSKELVMLFGGDAYLDSVMGLQLLAPILIFVPLAHFIGLQILYPHRLEVKYTISVAIASLANIVFNLNVIPLLQQNGAILGTCLAEFLGLVFQILFSWNYLIRTELFSRNTLKIIFSGVFMFIIGSIVNKVLIMNNMVIKLLFDILFSAVVYFLFLIILREKFLCKVLVKLTHKKQ